MTQGVRGEDLRKRGERGRHWEEVEAMAGPSLLVCVHGLGVESEPGTQSSCQPQKDGTTAPAPRHHEAPPDTTARRWRWSWSLAVNFGRKLLSARGVHSPCPPPTHTTPVWFRPSLSIAPGTSLLLGLVLLTPLGQRQTPKRAGPSGSSGPKLTNPVPRKS